MHLYLHQLRRNTEPHWFDYNEEAVRWGKGAYSSENGGVLHAVALSVGDDVIEDMLPFFLLYIPFFFFPLNLPFLFC